MAGKNLFGKLNNFKNHVSIKKQNSREIRASSLSIYNYLTFKTTLPNHLVKDKVVFVF